MTNKQSLYDVPEHSTYQGALTLARRLEHYWADRGVRIQVEVYPVGMHDKSNSGQVIYGVKSNTIIGAPHAQS